MDYHSKSGGFLVATTLLSFDSHLNFHIHGIFLFYEGPNQRASMDVNAS